MRPNNPLGSNSHIETKPSRYGRIEEKEVEKITSRAQRFFANHRRAFTEYSMSYKDLVQECLLVAHEITVMYPDKEGEELIAIFTTCAINAKKSR